MSAGTTQSNLSKSQIQKLRIPVPPVGEQERIVSLLSDVDEYIEKTSERVHALEQSKQAILLESPFGMIDLVGLDDSNPPEEYQVKDIMDVIELKNSIREPLNKSERDSMKSDTESYPYYGATGQVDSINDYHLDDKVILLAEDGGPYEEYFNKPVAYKVTGKCWINNHVHIIKNIEKKITFDYLFYVLEHAKVSRLAQGGRGKITKGNLSKLKIPVPSKIKQDELVKPLKKIDLAIQAATQDLESMRELKQGLLQGIFSS
jgi:type I restriction enzyme S subunit